MNEKKFPITVGLDKAREVIGKYLTKMARAGKGTTPKVAGKMSRT